MLGHSMYTLFTDPTAAAPIQHRKVKPSCAGAVTLLESVKVPKSTSTFLNLTGLIRDRECPYAPMTASAHPLDALRHMSAVRTR